MSRAPDPAPHERDDGTARRPEVVVDVERRAGAYLLVLANTGTATAYQPRATFEPRLTGPGGELAVSDLPIWSRLAMLRPGQRVEVLLDTEASDPQRFSVQVTYSDVSGRRYQGEATHDLGAYSGLPTLLG